jgi:hypothetical protein
MQIPSYIATLVRPLPKSATTERKLWAIGLSTTWLPFFTATNLEGATFIPAEAMGCPMRLVVGKDGEVRFSESGKPRLGVAKELSTAIRLVRENFVANLQKHANDVATENAEGYAKLVASYQDAGRPIAESQNQKMVAAITARYAKESAEAEADRALGVAVPEVREPVLV